MKKNSLILLINKSMEAKVPIISLDRVQSSNFRTIGSYTIDFTKLLGKGKYGVVHPAFLTNAYKAH
jgi:hypothetical protein